LNLKYLYVFIFTIISSLNPIIAADREYYQTVHVGESFSVTPWNISGLGGTCVSTSCSSNDYSALSVTKVYESSTHYWDGFTWKDGFSATYDVKALKTGSYQIYAVANGITHKGTNVTYVSASILIHVTVTNAPVVTAITIPNSLELSLGETYTFSPVVTQQGASTTLTWSIPPSSTPCVTSIAVAMKKPSRGNCGSSVSLS